MDYDFSKMEGEIATLISRITSSTLLAAGEVKESYSRPPALIPAAYAFFEVLVVAGSGSGLEKEWHQFLTEALAEVIRKAEGTYLN